MTTQAITQETKTQTEALVEECINTLTVDRELMLSFTPSLSFAKAQSFGSKLLGLAGQNNFRCGLETDEDFKVIGLHIYEKHKVEAA